MISYGVLPTKSTRVSVGSHTQVGYNRSHLTSRNAFEALSTAKITTSVILFWRYSNDSGTLRSADVCADAHRVWIPVPLPRLAEVWHAGWGGGAASELAPRDCRPTGSHLWPLDPDGAVDQADGIPGKRPNGV